MGYTAELRQRVANGALLIAGAGFSLLDAPNRLRLQQHTDNGECSTPGGALELGKTLEQAAKRELKEETGLDLDHPAFFTVLSGPEFRYLYPNGTEGFHWRAPFVGRYQGQPLNPRPAETKDLGFFDLNQPLPPIMGPVNQKAIALVQAALLRGEL